MRLNYFCQWKTPASSTGFQHNQTGVESKHWNQRRTLFESEEFSFTRNVAVLDRGFVRLRPVSADWGCGCSLTVRSRCRKAQRKSLGAASRVNPYVCVHTLSLCLTPPCFSLSWNANPPCLQTPTLNWTREKHPQFLMVEDGTLHACTRFWSRL